MEHPSLDGVWFRDFTRKHSRSRFETAYEDSEFMTEYLKHSLRLFSRVELRFCRLEADRSERELKESILRARRPRRGQRAAARSAAARRCRATSDEKYRKQAEEGAPRPRRSLRDGGWPVTEPAE